MALFLSLWDSRHACMDDWVERQRIAEVDRDRLTRAAVTIQSIRRGCVRRRQVREMRTACIVLQRIWRGFISREVATYDSMLRDKKRAQMLWYLAARTIQKTFRAFYSRRYRHSYYERQAYLSAVATKDNKIREVSEQVAESMFIERTTLHEVHLTNNFDSSSTCYTFCAATYMRWVVQATERNNFDKLAADLHHLKSTEHISGVFNSPYVEPLRAFGAPIEQHLTANFKKSKHCAKHLRRALGAQLYSQTYKKAAQNAGLATEGGTYQHASMPRPLDNSYTLGLRPLPE